MQEMLENIIIYNKKLYILHPYCIQYKYVL